MISEATLHTLSIIITPSIHLPTPPTFYVTTDHQIMKHEDIEYCEHQLVSKVLAEAHLVNTKNWILKWKSDQMMEYHICMGRPHALDFFKTNSHVQKQIRPILPIPIITTNHTPAITPLDFTKTSPFSLRPLIPIIRDNIKPYKSQFAPILNNDIFSPAPLLEDNQPHPQSPSYHPSLPIHSPHPSDYQPLEDMEIDEWNSQVDYASLPLVPDNATSSTDPLPSLQPILSSTSKLGELPVDIPLPPTPSSMSECPGTHIQYSTPSLTTNWKPEGGEREWPPAGLADSEDIWPNPIHTIEQWRQNPNTPFPSPSQSLVDLWASCPLITSPPTSPATTTKPNAGTATNKGTSCDPAPLTDDPAHIPASIPTMANPDIKLRLQ
ncbi:hypothetical protein JAAARDRAFT_196136 [Jaapia argillacea MUCL 33604]|uniref:Uncharacterized protein n=1 Tax=Jaapia argillacea MUCL 33604 TaxID=933084 RepID=A0A067PIT5_9AGAM|nr:hypothetical protein JAAARDRAFT_196136 [Jaapia argillacea MUCL 33604]